MCLQRHHGLKNPVQLGSLFCSKGRTAAFTVSTLPNFGAPHSDKAVDHCMWVHLCVLCVCVCVRVCACLTFVMVQVRCMTVTVLVRVL